MPRSPEDWRKMRENMTPEQREEARRKFMESLTPEQREAMMKRFGQRRGGEGGPGGDSRGERQGGDRPQGQ
jgi:Spy/CpxP family protein refolding chaperone